MKEYTIMTSIGYKFINPRRVKAKSIDNLRLRLIKEGILADERAVGVFTTNTTNVRPDTPFKQIGAIWYQSNTQDYYWIGQAGSVKNVSPKTGKLSTIKNMG